MSTVSDDVEFDDDEIVEPQEGGPDAKDRARALFAKWRLWPKWARVISVPVGLYVAFIVVIYAAEMLVSILGFGGKDAEATESPTTTAVVTATTVPETLDTSETLAGLPDVAPIVAAMVKPADRVEFRNRVMDVTADGTSICDVFFGVVTGDSDGRQTARWAVSTPAMQLRSGAGVELPSSAYPVRAFYGGSCAVPAKDVPLATTTTV